MAPNDRAELREIIQKFSQQKIIVVGDVILDEYLIGSAARLSREAPVPVLEFMSRQLIPGGAANPAVNIAALGGSAVQIGVVGADAEGASLRDALSQRGVDTAGIVTDSLRHTTVKTRIMAHMGLRFPQQIARLDKSSREALNPDLEAQIADFLGNNLGNSSAVLFSDYHICLNTPSLIDAARRNAVDGVLLSADAQGSFEKYSGFHVVKCNAHEAEMFLRQSLVTDNDFEHAARSLFDHLQLRTCMVITRGADGATAADRRGVYHVPAPVTTDVYDTVGAGDTAIAVITLALAAGAETESAVMLANYAGGLVVRRVGNYAPTAEELTAALR